MTELAFALTRWESYAAHPPLVQMTDPTQDKARTDLETIRASKARGPLATLGAYAKLSGPGSLQSAVTLGGGSLASSLYLGVLAGFSMLWLQPLAMLLGIVMLSAIAYVTLSTGERPSGAINRHVNPVLGWGWALAKATRANDSRTREAGRRFLCIAASAGGRSNTALASSAATRHGRPWSTSAFR